MTLTDIANLALVGLNAKAINSIDDDEVNARKAKLLLPNVIENVSASHTWSCLRRKIKLAHAPEKLEDGRYAYLEPKNLLKIISTYPETDFEREGGRIFAEPESLSIKCTICFYYPNEWDVLLRKAILSQLKAELAQIVVKDANLAANYMQLALKDLRDAMADDIRNRRNKRNRARCEFVDFDSYI